MDASGGLLAAAGPHVFAFPAAAHAARAEDAPAVAASAVGRRPPPWHPSLLLERLLAGDDGWVVAMLRRLVTHASSSAAAASAPLLPPPLDEMSGDGAPAALAAAAPAVPTAADVEDLFAPTAASVEDLFAPQPSTAAALEDLFAPSESAAAATIDDDPPPPAAADGASDVAGVGGAAAALLDALAAAEKAAADAAAEGAPRRRRPRRRRCPSQRGGGYGAARVAACARQGGRRRAALDFCGTRFVLRVLVAQLQKGAEGAAAGLAPVSSADVAWATQADCHGTMLELCVSLAGGRTDWPTLRALGVGFWLGAGDPLRGAIEAAAKTSFQRNRDPHEAALYYLALGKKSACRRCARPCATRSSTDSFRMTSRRSLALRRDEEWVLADVEARV